MFPKLKWVRDSKRKSKVLERERRKRKREKEREKESMVFFPPSILPFSPFGYAASIDRGSPPAPTQNLKALAIPPLALAAALVAPATPRLCGLGTAPSFIPPPGENVRALGDKFGETDRP